MSPSKIVPIVLLSLICKFASGQHHKLSDEELNKSTVVKMTFADTARNCESMDEWFSHDVKNHTVFLFLQGGLRPVSYPKDKDFENKYDVYFEDYGCLAPDYKCINRYNNNVFKYLTSIYGKSWIKELRKDIIGFGNWKANKRKASL